MTTVEEAAALVLAELKDPNGPGFREAYERFLGMMGFENKDARRRARNRRRAKARKGRGK